MQITYSVTPDDVAAAYSYNWKHEPHVRRKLILFAVLIAGFMYMVTFITRRGPLTLVQLLLPLIFGGLVLVALPYIAKLSTKTQPRTLTINPQGITTEIGTMRGAVPWKAVASIVRTDSYILITGKSTNVFVIPQNAFADEAQRSAFYELAHQYHDAITRLGST